MRAAEVAGDEGAFGDGEVAGEDARDGEPFGVVGELVEVVSGFAIILHIFWIARRYLEELEEVATR